MNVQTKSNLRLTQPETQPGDLLCSPDCPLCGGAGFYRLDLFPGQPGFGQLYVCENRRLAHLQPKGHSANGFAALLDINSMRSHVERIRPLLNQGFGFAFIWGSYGTGKTTLLKATVEEAIGLGLEAKFTSSVELLDDLRGAFDGENPNVELPARMRRWRTVPVLCLDEPERVNLTNFVEERLFQLLNDRYRDAIDEHSLTILASNLPPAKQPGYLTSRINDGRCEVIHVVGVDVRPGIKYSAESG